MNTQQRTISAYAFYQKRLSDTGGWAFAVSLLFVFSITIEYRVIVGGMLVHPYLLLLPLALLFSNVQIGQLPKKAFNALILFFTGFSLLCLRNSDPFSEIFKVGAAMFTFLFFAAAVKTEKDFRLTSWGFVICSVTIGIMGFRMGEEGEVSRLAGINVLEGIGNKNAQSLFTLPGLFFGLILLMKSYEKRKVIPLALLGSSIFFIIVGIFLSANRSGWVGLLIIIISFLFILGLKVRTIIIAGSLILFSYIAIENYSKDIFERKKEQTVEGYKSDVGRQQLIKQSINVGLDHIVFGAGYDDLHREMAERLGLVRYGTLRIDTHFLPGYLFGSSGIFVTFVFFLFLKRLTNRLHTVKTENSLVGRKMVIAFVVLFIVRSFFTREILYSPTFMGGLGLIYGYYIMQVRNARIKTT